MSLSHMVYPVRCDTLLFRFLILCFFFTFKYSFSRNEPRHEISNNVKCATSKLLNKLLTEQHLEFISLKEGCTGSSESTLVKMPHCWISHVTAQMFLSYLLPVVEYASIVCDEALGPELQCFLKVKQDLS